MKYIKPGHVYLTSVGIICIVAIKILLSKFWISDAHSTIRNIPLHQLDGIKITNSSLLPGYGGSDPFIEAVFVDKKFLQLVASSHHAAKPISLTSNDQTVAAVPDFSYLLNELKIVVNVKNFYTHSLNCKEIATIQVQPGGDETPSRLLHSGLYRNKRVVIEMAKPNMDLLVDARCGSSDSDHSTANLDRCFLLKNRFLLDESALLMQLPYRGIARMLGLCIQHGISKEKLDEKLSSAGVLLIRETGSTASIEKLKLLDWNERLKICMDLLNLANYFTKTALGSICLEKWLPENFILNSENKKIQLNNFEQYLSFTEPGCRIDQDCYIDGINAGIKCSINHCFGYNEKRNLLELNHGFLSPLLRHNSPSVLSGNILNLLITVKSLKLSALEVMRSLQKLVPKLLQEDQLDDVLTDQVNPAVLSMQKLPDGSQVDSSDQHENKAAINDVNPVLVNKAAPAHAELHGDDDPIEIKEYADPNGFRKIENADFPARYDYYCPGSKAEWGCVLSLRSIDDAKDHCLRDDKCKAFISIPHLRKEGWFIVILKSDSSNPVDHSGTTVYIREHVIDSQVPHELPPDDAVEAKRQGDCLNDVIKEQATLRMSLHSGLMEACGWSGMTSEEWVDGVKEGKIKDAKSFKPARGKLASGGQMDIVVEIGSKSYPAVFLAKRGPEEFDISQLAVYQVDRLLGFYKTVPAIEKLLSVEELTDAGFPVDVGGNQFDKFRSLKQSDGSLLGVIVPKVRERVSLEHYISVPRLSDVTNAVTPFNKKQWSDMEYLILGFLTSIPFSSKGHQAVKGRLLHLKNEEAFLHEVNDYVSYFYNCQFPKHVINVLRHSESRHCNLGSAIRTRLIENSSPDISHVLRGNVKKLLEVVDRCVTRFGKQVVLYDADFSASIR